jgi:hypothetical protein
MTEQTQLLVSRDNNGLGNNGNSNNDDESNCQPYEGVLNCCKIERVDVCSEFGQFFSFDLSKMPIINIYPSTNCKNTLVLSIDFDNNKQYKFYTNRNNRKNSSISSLPIVFLSNQTFKQFVSDLGLNYNVDSFL